MHTTNRYKNWKKYHVVPIKALKEEIKLKKAIPVRKKVLFVTVKPLSDSVEILSIWSAITAAT
jgi:hypothetical protein